MNQTEYQLIERYMLECMSDSAHDREHVYRVLYAALEIAGREREADGDILLAACLLHDIGRREQQAHPELCHAAVGAEKAYRFLMAHGWEQERAARVRDCIQTHRFRSSQPPESIEAKILFDADKLDAVGAMGIARTLCYRGIVNEPLYSLRDDGTVSDGSADTVSSFFREYKFKLEGLYDQFYTQRAAELAQERRQTAVDFYRGMLDEVRSTYEMGKKRLGDLVVSDT